MGTQFFIVFPERCGATISSNYFEQDVISEDYISQLCEKLELFKEVFEIEQFSFFYDRNNADNFSRAFVNDIKEQLLFDRIVGRAMPWNDNTCANEGYCHCAAIHNVPQYAHNSLCEAALRKRNYQNSIAIVQFGVSKMGMQSLPVEIGGKVIDLDIVPIELIPMYEWISKNRWPQRKYLWNKKHGEFGKLDDDVEDRYVSILRGSREEASQLLPYAIGGKNKYHHKLYIFDANNDAYEEFMPGQGNYHSYHVGDSKVPDPIIENLKMLGEARP
jgi:hypothetical protein